jgi:hypothetical protein
MKLSFVSLMIGLMNSNFKIHKEHIDILLFSGEFINLLKQNSKLLALFVILLP